MSKNPEHYPFEKFPRRNLSFEIPRGRFLSAILEEVLAYQKSDDGEEVHKLTQLGTWSDDQLSYIIPVVRPGANITISAGFVVGSSPGKNERIQLFPLDSPALSVFNMFNGYTPLGEAAKVLVDELDWESSRSMAYTRGLFLAMVVVGICQPKYSIHDQL